MPEIVLTEEQARVLAGVLGGVTVKDPSGRVVGVLDALPSPERIAELKRRAATPGPRYTGAQIQAQLQALEAERARIGPFDQAYMRDFLTRLEEFDPATFGPRPPRLTPPR